jgi:HlyD family secretion protein
MKIQKSKLVLLIPVIIIFTALVFWAAGINNKENYKVGIVEIDEVDVASKIPGRIEELKVKEGDKVTKGQILASLESKEIDAKVGQAKGAMEAAQGKLAMANNGARDEEKTAVEKLFMQAKHQFEFASKTKERFDNLYKDSVISTHEYDEINFKYNAAKDQMEAAEAKYNMVMKGARTEEKMAAEGLFYQAENAYNEAMAYYKELELIAPIDGEISNKIADQGEIIASGYPVFTIINPKEYYIVLQVREDELGNIKLGNYFNGTISALGNEQVEFKVTYISPMADFATWKPTNQKGDFDLKTFEIHLRSDKQIENLRPGMTVKINL